MIKYKVKDAATDLGVSNKEIIEILEKHCGVTKKTMTTLEESELDVIFDVITKKNKVENFDEYFAARNNKLDNESKPHQEDKPAKQNAKADNQKKKTDKNDKKPNNKDAKPASKQEKVEVTQEKSVEESAPRKRRVIDTRATNVDVERYNQKYDDLASDSSKGRSTDNIVKKQKFTNRTQRQKGRRQKRETEQERLNRIALERKQKPITVQIPDEIVVSELALRLKATVAEVVKKAFLMGTMVTATDTIDFDTASLIAMEFHAKVEKEVVVTIEEQIIDDSEDDEANLVERAPVVVVMGHVDHGKTSLLDAIRDTNVTEGEFGGITQHIGAHRVRVGEKKITFLDTPGHEAFTAMRARGALVTDIAILVVAADDGIMPQTIEAINHAKAAEVSIIVAINKIDKDGANPDKVKQELMEHGLVPEEWGGDTICVEVSAKKRQNIKELLEMVLLVAEMKELKANPDRKAKGTVIESQLDKGRGSVATVLVQNGTLHVGDYVVAGTASGRVRAMNNDKGKSVKKAGPSIPVEILGLSEVPEGGDEFYVVEDERKARSVVENRKFQEKKEKQKSATAISLDNLFEQIEAGKMKDLNIVVKADVQGSVEAVKQSLERISNDEVRVNVIHGAVGAINESDVMLASASNAIIVGFNVRPTNGASDAAEDAGVDLRMYRVIYDAIEDIEKAMKGMLEPTFREEVTGHVEIRTTFKVSGVGTIGGAYVLDGKIRRDSLVRVVRDGIVIHEGELNSLKRFKDDVKEVNAGYECGLSVSNYNDIKDGDIIEAYIMAQVEPE